MFIVLIKSLDSTAIKTSLWENTDKKEAFEYAKKLSTEDKCNVQIYKATLIAVAETAVTITKVRKTRVAKVKEEKEERFPRMPHKNVKEVEMTFTKVPSGRPFPELDHMLEEEVKEDTHIPINQRCALDKNLAVGKRKGPTGEYVFLCMDCMGAIGDD